MEGQKPWASEDKAAIVESVAAITIGVNNRAFSGIAAGNVFIVEVKMGLCSVRERDGLVTTTPVP
jgi:hypothetical protein